MSLVVASAGIPIRLWKKHINLCVSGNEECECGVGGDVHVTMMYETLQVVGSVVKWEFKIKPVYECRCDERLSLFRTHWSFLTETVQHITMVFVLFCENTPLCGNGVSFLLGLRLVTLLDLLLVWKIQTSVSHGSTKIDRKTKEFPRIKGTIFEMWWGRRHGRIPWMLRSWRVVG